MSLMESVKLYCLYVLSGGRQRVKNKKMNYYSNEPTTVTTTTTIKSSNCVMFRSLSLTCRDIAIHCDTFYTIITSMFCLVCLSFDNY